MRRSILLVSLVSVIAASILTPAQTTKPNLTLDEFFDSVSFDAVRVSPDGNSVVIGTEKADWDQQIFRKELWLYRIAANGGKLVQLTQARRARSAHCSPY